MYRSLASGRSARIASTLADELVLNDDRGGFGVLDDVADLRPDQPEVDRHRDQAGFGQRRVDFQPFEAVVGKDRDPVALVEPDPDQGVGKPAGAIVPLTERHRSRQIAPARLIRKQPRVHGDDLAEMEHLGHR